MKNAALIALAASAKLAFAHTTIFAAWINDVDQGLGNSADGYIRSPPNNDPVKDVTSSDMTCNVNNVATAKTLSVASGDKFTFEWHHNDRSDSDDIIASSHKGPVMVYIAPTDTGSSGDNWVKLYEDGYDASTGLWAVDTLITNKGKHSITIPDITAGDYLLRAEIIALHEAENVGGAQFYMECVQVKVTGSGTTALPSGVSIPGAYTATDAGIEFNMYGDFSSYPIPGPTVWSGAAASGAASTAAASSTVAASSSVVATSSAVASSSAVATSSAVVASSSAVATSSAVVVASSSAPATSAVSTQVAAASSSFPATSSAAPYPTISAVQSSIAAPSTFATVVVSSTSASAVSAPAASGTSASGSGSSSGSVALYGRCGGIGYTGATTCASGATCKVQNPYYSQCVASS